MRSRVAAILTVGALLAGTGGAIAVGQSGSSGGPLGGAASGQYCGGKNHKCPKPKHNCGKHHNQTCPPPKKHHKTTHGKPTHTKPSHKGKKKTSTKTTGSIPWPNCTIRQAGSVVIAYCP